MYNNRVLSPGASVSMAGVIIIGVWLILSITVCLSWKPTSTRIRVGRSLQAVLLTFCCTWDKLYYTFPSQYTNNSGW